MAINRDNDGRLVITMEWSGDYETIHDRIEALVSLLQAAESDMVNKKDVYSVCAMILDLLPCTEDFLLLEKAKKELLSNN